MDPVLDTPLIQDDSKGPVYTRLDEDSSLSALPSRKDSRIFTKPDEWSDSIPAASPRPPVDPNRLKSISIKSAPSLYNSLMARSHSSRTLNRMSLAAKYVLDARAGLAVELQVRDIESPLLKKISQVRRSSWYRWIIRLVILLHCGLLIFETKPFCQKYTCGTLWFELLFFLVYIIDIAFGIADERFERYIKNYWHALYTFIVTVLLCQVLVALWAPSSGVYQYFRVLRPIMLLSKFKTLRMLFRTMLNIVPHIVDTLLLGFVLASFYAILGVAIFHDIYDQDPVQYALQNFDNFGTSMLAMLVLFTTENFPDIVLPGLEQLPGTAAVFFCSFMVVGVWLYMSLLLAVIFDTYKQLHEKEVLSIRVREQQSLLMAFSIMHDVGETIDFNAFSAMMQYVRPGATADEIRVLFKCIDENCNGSVDPEEFLQMADVLRYELTPMERERRRNEGAALNICQRMYYAFMFPSPEYQHYIENVWFKRGVRLVIVLNLVVLCVWYRGMSPGLADVIHAVNILCVTLFCLEMIFKMYILGLREYLHFWSGKLDFFIILLSFFVEICAPSSVSASDASGVHWIQVFRAVRVLRLITALPSLNRMVSGLAKAAPVMARLLGLLAILFYIYVVIGLEAFAVEPHDVDPTAYDPETFLTLWQGLLSLFQIATSNNWNNVMYTLSNSLWDTIFFVTFYFAVCVILLNIVTALVIEAYEAFSSKQAAGGGDDDDPEGVVYISSEPCPFMVPSGDRSSTAGKGHKHEHSSAILKDHAHNYAIFRVEKSTDWSRMLVGERLPELKKQEISSLKSKVEELQAKLERMASRERYRNALKRAQEEEPIGDLNTPSTPSVVSPPDSQHAELLTVL